MHAHYLQHVPFEGLGNIEPLLSALGYVCVTSTQLYKSSALPSLKEIDLLIVLGGPMSANDEMQYSWLNAEKQFIYDAISSGKSVLGICLGAQLIARSMGASITNNQISEIGWFPVEGLNNRNNSIFTFPSSFEAFHWHSETFSIPKGALHLARTAACENQAFQLGKSVIGLQFHLEANPQSINEIIKNCHAEMMPSEYVQSEQIINVSSLKQYKKSNEILKEILLYLTRHHKES